SLPDHRRRGGAGANAVRRLPPAFTAEQRQGGAGFGEQIERAGGASSFFLDRRDGRGLRSAVGWIRSIGECRSSPVEAPGGWWWLVGDLLHYLGLLSAMVSLPGLGLALVAGLPGFGWHWLPIALGAFAGGAVGVVLWRVP